LIPNGGSKNTPRHDKFGGRIVNKAEFILNLAWMLLCIGALSAQVWRDRLRSGSRNRSIRLRRSLSVLIAALALFPVISASDDRIRLADLKAVPAQESAFDRGQSHNPLNSAAFEDPGHGQTADPFFLIVIMCFFAIALMGTSALARWLSIATVGRAPPQPA
jgi:hypothetical protein